jgi:Pentapeptide repeats (8 copies)
MFQGANLAAATLEDTDLNGAKFTNANLEVHFFRMLFEMLLPYLYKLLKLNE